MLNGRNKHAATAVDICTAVVHLRRQVIYSDMFLAGSWYSYYTVYRTPRVTSEAVNCVMQTWKVVFYPCYCNLNLSFSAKYA